MIILVCGGRHYHDYEAVKRALDSISGQGIDLVIHGGASGADKLGRAWADENGIHHAEVPALWHRLGRREAGPKRNRAMLLLQPHMVVAFPGRSGTADMIRAAESAGVVVWRPYE